jgi:integrase
MTEALDIVAADSGRVPWNKGKIIGAKPPLRPKHVWSIRTKLQLEGRVRDLALFNLAIDSKLRGCDVVTLKVDDIAPSGYAVDRASVRQKKTGRPVRFELTEATRQAVDDYMKVSAKKPGDYLFTGRRGANRSLTTRQYARLLAKWIATIAFRPASFRNALAAPDQSNPNLPADRQLARGTAALGAHQDREYGPISWNRSR